MKKSVCSMIAIFMVMLCLCSCGKKENADPTDTQSGENGIHHVEMKVKNYGAIKLELDGNTAPITTENFVTLAKEGFYDGLTFHRIMSGFIAQGGDPNGNGTGGSGKTIKGEFAVNGIENNISHTRGTISMGRNSFSYDSASSQFFICHQNSTFLDGQYAAFGHVTEGMEVIDKICENARPIDNNGKIPADQQPIIEKVTVID